MKIKLVGYITAFLLLVGPLFVVSKRTTELFKLGEGSVRMGNRDVQDEFEEQVTLPKVLTKTGTLGSDNELAKRVEEMEERVDKLEDLAKIGTLRSCAEYTKHGLKKSGLYMVDPDGALQGQEPFKVYCDFNAVATEVFHDTESSTVMEHCRLPGCYNKSITYINGQDQSPISQSQILSLMELAEYCTQEIRFDCTLAPLNVNDVNNGYWFDRHGEKNIYFTGSNYGDHVCDCHYDDGGCIDEKTWGNRCNCDANIPVRSSDKGTITNMTALPVSQMFFGGLKYDMQFAAFTLGRLKCYGERDVDLATSCSALKRKGILQSGYYHIKAANDVHPSLVFCDMQSPTYAIVTMETKLKQSALNLIKIDGIDTKLKQLEHYQQKFDAMETKLNQSAVNLIKINAIETKLKQTELEVKNLEEVVNILFKGQRLYSSNGETLFKVQVAYGTRLSEGSVPDTCEAAGMKAVCNTQDVCQYNSARCQKVSIETSCGNPMQGVAKLICNENNPGKCPQLEGVFSYFHKWSGGECGAVGGKWCVKGKDLVSSSVTPFFAYCVHSI